MEKNYYPGLLVITQDLVREYREKFDVHQGFARSQYKNIPLSKELNQLLVDIENGKIQDGKITEYKFTKELTHRFVRYLPDTVERENYCIPILFEPFTDEYGAFYGRELTTGLVFLIGTPHRFNLSFYVNFATSHKPFTINYQFNGMKADNMIEIGSFIVMQDERVLKGHEKEVEEYLKKYCKKTTMNKKVKEYKNKIKAMDHLNLYEKEVKESSSSNIATTRQQKTAEAKIMENIEYLLSQLSSYNASAYLEYSNEYQTLLEGNNDSLTLSPLLKSTLISFEAKLEFILRFSKNNATNITDYLSALKHDYLANILSNEPNVNFITIEEINKITELFLRGQNDYSLVAQRQVGRDIAFLYILEIYRNRECISELDLTNTYFADNLKTILTILNSLRSLGIIKNNIMLSLDNIPSPSSVLSLIKNIEFNYFEKSAVKELIRKI